MARSKETFGKKDREKKKLKDRKEKEEKMEQRKEAASKGKSLEDMMAYLDENGNLTDKPPDPHKKKIFRQEDIQINVPKQEEFQPVFRTGTISFFDRSKGFGFIQDQGNERIFFHVNNLEEDVNESDKVIFLPEKGPRGLSALQVKKVK